MSADFELFVKEGMEPTQLQALLAEVCPGAAFSGRFWALPGSAVWLNAVDAEDRVWMAPTFGVAPSVGVRFTNTSTPEGFRTMKRVIGAVLRATGSDGVLVFNGETPVWEHKGGNERDLSPGWDTFAG